jgi:hypothetical protein
VVCRTVIDTTLHLGMYKKRCAVGFHEHAGSLRVLIQYGFATLLLVLGLKAVSWHPENVRIWLLTPGRSVDTVPLSLAVSATPSPFLLFSGCFEICEVWWVSLLDKPSCFPDVSFCDLGVLRGSG